MREKGAEEVLVVIKTRACRLEDDTNRTDLKNSTWKQLQLQFHRATRLTAMYVVPKLGLKVELLKNGREQI